MARTSLDLFRAWNASGPRMDNVRSKDIDVYALSGIDWVRAGTGGISTFDVASSTGGIWWRLPRGYDHGSRLRVWNDHGQHWLWEPAQDTPLSDYRFELAKTHAFFVRI